MRRSAPAPGARRAGWLGAALTLTALLGAGCSAELQPLDDKRSPRGTLGEEVYKMLCRRVAGTEIPEDLEGVRTQVICLGDAAQVAEEVAEHRDQYPARVAELAARRPQLAAAIDAAFPGDLADGFEHLMRQLVPFYDPPEELFQKGTRALAGVLQRMAADPKALGGLEQLGRQGMVTAEGDLGLYRAMLTYDQLTPLLAVLLPELIDDKGVAPFFQTLLTGSALELATTTLDDAPDSDTNRTKRLLARSRPEFASGASLWVADRDARGMPVPSPLDGDAVPFPFVDDDKDGLADVKDGRFVPDPKFGRDVPEPLRPASEVGVERDDRGAAYAFTADGQIDRTRTLFELQDVDDSLLAGGLLEAGKLFKDQSQIAVHMAGVSSALFGKRVQTQRQYGAFDYSYSAPDSNDSPAVDMMYASTTILQNPLYDQSMELTQTLLESHETEFVGGLEPLLQLEKRTRKESDAYPEAQLPKQSIFWDQLLLEAERVSRRRKTEGGPTMLELLLRGALGFMTNAQKSPPVVEQVVDPKVLAHQGAMIAALMRYKDEWRGNPKGESERAPGEPATIGSFTTPVDRTKPDSPVTCGKDGCGGPIAGTPFEPWAKAGQNCMVQRDGRPASSKDCGAPANQSIMQRSLGLVWEMAGRSQCNKPITLGDLLDFALLKDACKYLDTQVACAAQAQPDAYCAAQFGGNADYVCDTQRDLCIAGPASQTCADLKLKQRQDRQDTITNGEQQLYQTYRCPPDQAGAACQAYVSQYPAAFVDTDGPNTGAPSQVEPCHLLNLPDVGRSFGRALTHEFVIEVPNPWLYRYLEDTAFAGNPALSDCPSGYQILDPKKAPGCIPGAARLSRDALKIPAERQVDTLGELIAFLLDDSSLFTSAQDLADLRPNVSSLTRVLFSAPGSSSLLVFDPLLIHGAPKSCADAPSLPACAQDDTAPTPAGGCCIADLSKPPFRYRLDTYYSSTSFAWEQPVKFTDGTEISMLEAMKPLADAANRTDYEPGVDDPKNFEGTDYIFSTLGKVVGEHYDSPANPLAQNKDPNGAFYRRFSNLVSYERLLADALDDGTADPEQLGPAGAPLFDKTTLPTAPEQQLGMVLKAYPLLELMLTLPFGQHDGEWLTSAFTELLLSPHASCAPPGGDLRVVDGKGACDHAAEGAAGFTPAPKYRDGTSYICWNDGSCLNKAGDYHWPSPLYIGLDAFDAILERIDGNADLQKDWSGVRAGLFDEYLTTADGTLADRRMRAVLLVLLNYTRDRWAEELQKGTLASFAKKITSDTVKFVTSPFFSGALGMIEGLTHEQVAMDALNRFSGSMLGQAARDTQVRALVASISDYLESLPGDDELVALTKLVALGIVPNVDELVLGRHAQPALEDGMIWRNLLLLRETVVRDNGQVVGKISNNLAYVPGAKTKDERASAMSNIVDVLFATNRLDIGSNTSLSAAEWKAVLTRVADVMLDERRGFERLYRIVQCRNGSTKEVSCD